VCCAAVSTFWDGLHECSTAVLRASHGQRCIPLSAEGLADPFIGAGFDRAQRRKMDALIDSVYAQFKQVGAGLNGVARRAVIFA